MGDTSEIRGLIVIVTFLGATAILYGFIPTQFYTVAEERQVEVPTLFESLDIYSYAETVSFWMQALLNIPLWVSVGYLVFILVLRAIGAIFGGGA